MFPPDRGDRGGNGDEALIVMASDKISSEFNLLFTRLPCIERTRRDQRSAEFWAPESKDIAILSSQMNPKPKSQ